MTVLIVWCECAVFAGDCPISEANKPCLAETCKWCTCTNGRPAPALSDDSALVCATDGEEDCRACDAGFAGVDCSSRACLNGCSGHGVCEQPAPGDAALLGSCRCQQGWTGPDCSAASAAGAASPLALAAGSIEVETEVEPTGFLQMDGSLSCGKFGGGAFSS